MRGQLLSTMKIQRKNRITNEIMKDLTYILLFCTFVAVLNPNRICKDGIAKRFFLIVLQQGNPRHFCNGVRIQNPHRGFTQCCPSASDYIGKKSKYSISNVRTQQHFSNKFHALPTLQRGGHAFNKVNRETPIPYSVVGEVCSNLTSLLKLNLKQWLFNNMTINGLLCLKVNK